MTVLQDTPPAPAAIPAQGITEGAVISDRYQVVQQVGMGGFGVVYEVEHLTLKKRFALKVLSHGGAEEIERLRREAMAISRISHPNIVAITDFGSIADGEIYYVMELLQGESLRAVIDRKKTFSLSTALPILAAAAHALQAAHEAGVIHRDLKPSNIFVTPLEDAQRGGTRDFVKILDFGLAKLKLPPGAEKLTDHDMTVGTPAYASPEQLQRNPIDGRADIYSLGCIAFELFTGKQLFTGPAIRVMVSHVEDHAPRVRQRNPRARISDDMEQLIARCLEKLPEDRFATCNHLLEALREIARVQLTPEGQTWTGAYEPDARRHAAEAWLEDTDETPWWEQISSERLVGVSNEFAEETRPDSGPFGVNADQSDQRSTPRLAIRGLSPLDRQKTAEVAASAFNALLVDDDRALAEELVEILGLHDCSMRVADGASALEAARQRRPSVILASVELAGASGYTLCSRLKKDPALCKVPVVLMCDDAKDEVFEMHRTLPVCADHYLAKPLRREELIDVLKSVLLTPPAGQPESAARPGSPREDPTELVVRDARPEERARRSHMGLLLVGLALLLTTVSIAVYLTITL